MAFRPTGVFMMQSPSVSRFKCFLAQIRGDGLKAQLLRGGMGSITVRVFQMVLSFLLTLILARTLGPGGYGVYAFAFAFLTLLAIPAQVGLPQLVVRETAKAHAKEDWLLMRGIWQWTMRFVFLFSLAVVMGVGGVLWLGQPWIDPTRHATLIAGLLLVPLIALGNLRGAALRGLHHVVLGQLPESIIPTGLLAVLIVLVVWLAPTEPLTPQKVMTLHVVSVGFAFAIGAWLLWRFRPGGVKVERQSRREPAAWRRAALPLALVSGLQLFNSYADILLLGMMRTDVEVGVYRVVVQMSNLVMFGLGAVNLVLQPHFARLYAQGDQARLQQLVTTSARVILALALPPVLLLMFAGGPLMGWLFGSAYVIGAIALSILAVGQLCNAAVGSVGALLNMTGHEQDTLRGVACAAVVNVVLNLVLIPLYGMAGAAVATAVSLGVWNLILWKFVWKRLGIESTVLVLRR